MASTLQKLKPVTAGPFLTLSLPTFFGAWLPLKQRDFKTFDF